MTLVIDASVALKWVMQEDGTDRARALVAQEVLVAPDLLLIECANVLAIKARRGQISPDAARVALEAIEATPIRIVPSRVHVVRAQGIAMALGQTAYDSLYLAVALAEQATLVTADMAFARAAMEASAYAGAVRTL